MPEQRPARFFMVDDGGDDYYVVAHDVDHAKSILRAHGVNFTKDNGESAPIDDPAFLHLSWVEIPRDRADRVQVYLDDGSDGPYPLSTRPVGDWFTSNI